MSKWEAIGKMLGIAAEDAAKLAPETIQTLKKIKTPEISTALKGEERAKYLRALDETYGPQAKRANDMGMSLKKKDWVYHGTGSDFDEFDPSKLSRDANGHFEDAKPIYVSSSPSVASEYAEEARLGSGLDSRVQKAAKDFETHRDSDRYIKEVDSIYDRAGEGVGENVMPLTVRSEMPISFQEAEKIRKSGSHLAPWFDLVDDPVMKYKSVKNPNQLRSVNAAFDPRFKDSAKLLAGAAAMPTMGLGDQLKTFSDEVAQPISKGWENIKSMISKPLSKQLNLTKDPSQAEGIEQTLNVVADPTNLVGGGAGAAIGAMQMLGDMKKKKGEP